VNDILKFILKNAAGALIGAAAVWLWVSGADAFATFFRSIATQSIEEIDAFEVVGRQQVRPPHSNKIDVDIYHCTDSALYESRRSQLVAAFGAARWGGLDFVLINPSDNARTLFGDRFSIVFDTVLDESGAGEWQYVGAAFEALARVSDDRYIQVLPNTGEKTQWALSVFVC
jgi:hypothetical protein